MPRVFDAEFPPQLFGQPIYAEFIQGSARQRLAELTNRSGTPYRKHLAAPTVHSQPLCVNLMYSVADCGALTALSTSRVPWAMERIETIARD